MDSGILSISLLAAWSLIYFIIKSIFDTDIKETDEQGKVLPLGSVKSDGIL